MVKRRFGRKNGIYLSLKENCKDDFAYLFNGNIG